MFLYLNMRAWQEARMVEMIQAVMTMILALLFMSADWRVPKGRLITKYLRRIFTIKHQLSLSILGGNV